MLTWIRSPGGTHIHYADSGDAFDAVDTTVTAIQDALSNLGGYCVDWIEGGLSIFHQLVTSATQMLTFDTSDNTFLAFNTVVNRVSGVLTIIASSLLVMFFLTSLAGDAWDTRHELDVWSLTKDIVKLIVSVVVVNNALYLTRLIFNTGAGLAELVLDSSVNMDKAVELPEDKSQYLINGVSGIGGVMLLITFVLAAVVIAVCGIMITIEIYQRIFKIYILIPCSTLAFSTFVISSGRGGHEVFGGYVKSICQTALEAMIIMLAISFTYMLVDNSAVMNALFPADVFESSTATVKSEADYKALLTFMEEYNDTVKKNYSSADGSNGFKKYLKSEDEAEISVSAFASADYSGLSGTVSAVLDGLSHSVSAYYYSGKKNGTYSRLTASKLSDLIEIAENGGSTGSGTHFSTDTSDTAETTETAQTDSSTAAKYPAIYVRVYPEASAKDALMMIAQLIFPCIYVSSETGT